MLSILTLLIIRTPIIMKGKVYCSVDYAARVLIWPKTFSVWHWHCTVTGMNIDIYGGLLFITKEFLAGFSDFSPTTEK